MNFDWNHYVIVCHENKPRSVNENYFIGPVVARSTADREVHGSNSKQPNVIFSGHKK